MCRGERDPSSGDRRSAGQDSLLWSLYSQWVAIMVVIRFTCELHGRSIAPPCSVCTWYTPHVQAHPSSMCIALTSFSFPLLSSLSLFLLLFPPLSPLLSSHSFSHFILSSLSLPLFLFSPPPPPPSPFPYHLLFLPLTSSTLPFTSPPFGPSPHPSPQTPVQ